MTIDRKIIWQETKDYFNITLGLMLYTFGFTVFLLPYEIVTGGIAGIGAIIFYATKFPVQWTFFIINAILIVAALKELGLKFLAKTIYATIALTVLLELAQKIVEQPDGTFYKLMGEGNDFMSLIIGCMLTGTALAVVFLNNGSTGGTDIIAAVVNKHYNVSLDERAAPVGAVHDILEGIQEDSRSHHAQDRPHAHHSRRPRLVHRQGNEGDMSACQEARIGAHLPIDKDDRPACLRQSE